MGPFNPASSITISRSSPSALIWRASRSRGLLFYRLLEQSVQHDPVTYRDVVDLGRNRPVALDWS